ALFALDSNGFVSKFSQYGPVVNALSARPNGHQFTTITAATNQYGLAAVFALDQNGKVFMADPGNLAGASWTELPSPGDGFTTICAAGGVARYSAMNLYNTREDGLVLFAAGKDKKLY